MQDQSRLHHQVNIVLGGVPGLLSGASSLVGIRVPFAYDPRYCYTYGVLIKLIGYMVCVLVWGWFIIAFCYDVVHKWGDGLWLS